MDGIVHTFDNGRYAQCIAASKRVRWEIEEDEIRGRRFDAQDKYRPDGLSMVGEFTTLSEPEKRFVSQIQGRTYKFIECATSENGGTSAAVLPSPAPSRAAKQASRPRYLRRDKVVPTGIPLRNYDPSRRRCPGHH